MDEARRLLSRNHLTELIPSQEWHLPHWAEWGGMGAFCEVEQSIWVRRTSETQGISMNAKMPGKCFPDRRVLREVIGQNIRDRLHRDPNHSGQFLFSHPLI